MSSKYLHPEIREKGGAYGGGATAGRNWKIGEGGHMEAELRQIKTEKLGGGGAYGGGAMAGRKWKIRGVGK